MKILLFILRPFLWFLAALPLSLLYILSSLAYLVGYRLLGYRRSTVAGNLSIAFADQNQATIKKIEKAFYHHFFDLLVESFKLHKTRLSTISQRTSVANPEVLNQYFDQGQNVILVMGHSGNWEWLDAMLNPRIKHQLQSLYQPAKNPHVDDFIRKNRTQFGTKVIERKIALRALLKANTPIPTATIFLADQSPSEMKKATWLPFFSKDSPFFNGYAAFAKKLNNPIVYLHIEKKGRGKYEVQFTDLIPDPSSFSKEDMVEKFSQTLEGKIKAQPFNWLWSHKRWKRAHLSPNLKKSTT